MGTLADRVSCSWRRTGRQYDHKTVSLICDGCEGRFLPKINTVLSRFLFMKGTGSYVFATTAECRRERGEQNEGRMHARSTSTVKIPPSLYLSRLCRLSQLANTMQLA